MLITLMVGSTLPGGSEDDFMIVPKILTVIAIFNKLSSSYVRVPDLEDAAMHFFISHQLGYNGLLGGY